MNGRTHLLTGIAGGLMLATITPQPQQQLLIFGGVVLGSLLPDIDHPQSIISGWIPFGSLVLGLARVGHRTLTHSLLAIAVVILVPYAYIFFAAEQYVYVVSRAIAGGMVIHIIGDMATAKGVPLLYPLGGYWKFAPGKLLFLTGWLIESVVNVGALGMILYAGAKLLKIA